MYQIPGNVQFGALLLIVKMVNGQMTEKEYAIQIALGTVKIWMRCEQGEGHFEDTTNHHMIHSLKPKIFWIIRERFLVFNYPRASYPCVASYHMWHVSYTEHRFNKKKTIENKIKALIGLTQKIKRCSD